MEAFALANLKAFCTPAQLTAAARETSTHLSVDRTRQSKRNRASSLAVIWVKSNDCLAHKKLEIA